MANQIWGMGKLPSNSVMQYPSGRWGFVGSVDSRLAYVRKDGSEATEDDLSSARIAGPNVAGLKTRTFDTKEAALAAAEAISAEVSNA